MLRVKGLCILILQLVALSSSSGDDDWPIKNVVVLMLENRSFDHVLGYLKRINPNIDGLTGNEYNLYDPRNSSSPKVKVSFDSPYDIGLNPGHSLEATEQELWGSYTSITPAPMDGFVYNALSSHSPAIGSNVMRCFNSSSLPAISNLALDFALFDQWHSSVPGPTFPNRLFFLSGTSQGTVSNVAEDEVVGFDQRTIFDDIYDSGLDFNIYYSDFPTCLILRRLREYPEHVHMLEDFFANAKAGTLPEFSWVEPRWFDFWEWQENDQHPPHNMAQGEFLIKEVYEAVRNSPQWNETLLIVTYDEHGGLYDHVSPPTVGIPNPDGINSTNPPFAFDRLGIRVPMVMVSPWIEGGSVYAEPSTTHYDHTSVAATLRKMFKLKQPPLTKREAWAATWESVINRQTPRTDCPTTLPVPDDQQELWKAYKQSQSIKESEASIAKMKLRNPDHIASSPIMSDLQQEIINIAKMVVGEKERKADTVYEGATLVRDLLQQYFQSHPKRQQ